MTTPTPIQRYEASARIDGPKPLVHFSCNTNGKWVLYDDHLAAMAAKDAEIARLHGLLALLEPTPVEVRHDHRRTLSLYEGDEVSKRDNRRSEHMRKNGGHYCHYCRRWKNEVIRLKTVQICGRCIDSRSNP